MKNVKKFSSLKMIGRNIWAGICYLLNRFQNPARKSASCQIEKFPTNSEKKPGRSSSKTAKMATMA